MQIGPYRIEQELGRGGMGVVYRASDESGQQVAVKVALASRDGVAAARLRRELSALLKLRHPNLVSLRGSGVHEGKPYLVLDLVQGETLDERVAREGPLDPLEAAGCVATLARAVDEAHRCQILHRDIKPANVFLTDAGTSLLADFGLARDLTAPRSSLTQSGLFLGTPGYWAPEQAAGQPERFGVGTDVYGLGATLYFALTGLPPHRGDSLAEVATNTMRGAPPLPSTERPGLPARLEAICMRCLSLAPEDRFSSAAELAQALGGLRPTTRKRRLRPLVAGGLLAVVAGAWGLSGPRAPKEPVHDDDAAVVDLTRQLARVEASGGDDPQLRARLIHALGHRVQHRRDDLNGRFDAECLADAERAVALGGPPEGRFNALLVRGKVYLGLGRHEEALPDLTQAVELSPQSHEALTTLGTLLIATDRHEDAIKIFGRVLAADPDHVFSRASRALAYLDSARYREAVNEADRALILDPKQGANWWLRGVAKTRLGALPSALNDLDHALELSPGEPMALRDRGIVKVKLGDSAGGRDDLQAALALRHEWWDAWLFLGHAQLELEDFDGAEQSYQHAQALSPKSWEPVNGRGVVMLRLGRFDAAREAFEQALELGSTANSTHANLSIVAIQSHDWEAAKRHALLVLEREPGDLRSRSNLALGLAQLGQRQAATREAERLADESREVPDMVRAMELCFLLELPGLLEAVLARGHELHPGSPALVLGQAKLSLLRGDYTAAQRSAEEAARAGDPAQVRQAKRLLAELERGRTGRGD